MNIYGIEIPEKERFKEAINDILKGKGGTLIYLSIIGIILGIYAVARIVIEGHGYTTNTNSQVPWGLQIATYVYLVLISTGCTFVNFFGYIFYEKEYKPISARVLFIGIFTAIAGMGALSTELGHVERLYNWLLSPNPTSAMWWMAVFYTIYVIVIAVEFINIKRNKHSKGLMWTAFIAAIITHSTLGALFGAIEQRFYYYSALFPIYFLIIAFLTGSAVVAIVAAISVKQSPANDGALLKPMRNFLGIGLGLAFLLTLWRLLIGIYGQAEGSHIFELTIWNQIIVGLFLAAVLPFIIMLYLKGPNSLIITGLFIIAVQLKTRLDLVISGFKMPLFRAYDIPEIISYTPSHVEIFIFTAAASFAIFVYLLADKLGFLEVKEGVK